MKSRAVVSFLLFVLSACLPAAAQKTTLTLEQCITIALESNVQVRQARNAVTVEEVGVVRSKFDFLPGVSGSVSGTKNFGRTVDNFTQAIAQSPYTMNMSLGTSLVLFRGFSKWNEYHRAEHALKAAEYSLEDLKNDIRLNVALAFFNATFARDNLKVTDNNRKLLEKQLTRMQQLIQSGSVAEGELAPLRAEIARAEAAMVTAQNTYERAVLDLILAINADPTQQYELERPDLEGMALEGGIDSEARIYEWARENDPAVREQEMRILAAKYAMQSAKSGFYPTISVNYGAYSFFSSNARPLDSIRFVDGEITQFFGPTTPFGTQFADNLSHGVTLNINIPIFSNYATRQNYIRAELNYENALLEVENVRNEVYKSVVLARQDAVAAKAQLEANANQVYSTRIALEYAEKRFEAGALDFYSLQESINNYTQAEVELIRTKYDYILKIKVLDLYQGKGIRF